MSTKNLAHTIIEGGRSGYSKWERRRSHTQERVLFREFLAQASGVEDGFEALCVGLRPKVRKDFSDKLGAPRRWLHSQVGRPWDKVRSEIFTRFDPRSLAGQHIIFDHLLREVVPYGVLDRVSFWRRDLYVDRQGMLRAIRPTKRCKYSSRIDRRPTQIPDDVRHWANDRRVGGEGLSLFWLVAARTCEGCVSPTRTECCCPIVDDAQRHGRHVHYRQGHRLDPDELKFWQSIDDERVRDQLFGPRRECR
jgi:hypothetical protein